MGPIIQGAVDRVCRRGQIGFFVRTYRWCHEELKNRDLRMAGGVLHSAQGQGRFIEKSLYGAPLARRFLLKDRPILLIQRDEQN